MKDRIVVALLVAAAFTVILFAGIGGVVALYALPFPMNIIISAAGIFSALAIIVYISIGED